MNYVLIVKSHGQIITCYGPLADEGAANRLIIRDQAIFRERTYEIKPLIPAV